MFTIIGSHVVFDAAVHQGRFQHRAGVIRCGLDARIQVSQRLPLIITDEALAARYSGD
ncbi:hypothetical protein [Thiosulfatihalobacter marinus]|uniref:hypothetical protein n=1 Tax=Thiosulfatihalobacter marinus TaxID=2792481 RepID=UPI0018D7BC3F|nr:hypothetical protein [Thiosulfatihalobacter marinus]